MTSKVLFREPGSGEGEVVLFCRRGTLFERIRYAFRSASVKYKKNDKVSTGEGDTRFFLWPFAHICTLGRGRGRSCIKVFYLVLCPRGEVWGKCMCEF
jgi:hypothetical protein